MTPKERIVELALEAVADGIDEFPNLVDYCLNRAEFSTRHLVMVEE